MKPTKKVLRIGNAGGYWGDDPKALERQVRLGQIDYITIDFLAEITMSILQKQKRKNPNLGYATTFVDMIKPVFKDIKEKGIKVITNAGGVNPDALAKALLEASQDLGLELRVAVVKGDDVVAQLDELSEHQPYLQNMETQQEFRQVRDRIEAANVYLGAKPVVHALKTFNPDIIVTGRVTDTGITLAPMIYEFGWSESDWNLLAKGIIAGHLLECGCQVSGGNFTDWKKVKSFSSIGYPIAEINADGEFFITKHENTGGLISRDTIREQLVYEMGDPSYYITPDVVVDLKDITVNEKDNKVYVSGIFGHPPTPFYKVSMAYKDGYKTSGSVLISGPEPYEKASAFAKIFLEKVENLKLNVKQVHTEFIGYDSCHRSLKTGDNPAEILLRLSAKSNDYHHLRQFGSLIASLILSGPPGVCVIGGNPKPTEIMNYWPCLISQSFVKSSVCCFAKDQNSNDTHTVELNNSLAKQDYHPRGADQSCLDIDNPHQAMDTGIAIQNYALARSGDKGDAVNIGLIARKKEYFDHLKKHVTAQNVKIWFEDLCLGKVERFEVAGIDSLNFILHQALGGGGASTLRVDAQGKTFAQALLAQKIPKLDH